MHHINLCRRSLFLNPFYAELNKVRELQLCLYLDSGGSNLCTAIFSVKRARLFYLTEARQTRIVEQEIIVKYFKRRFAGMEPTFADADVLFRLVLFADLILKPSAT